MARIGCFQGFSPGLFRFLGELAQNNNREWFDRHRTEYQSAVALPIKAFVSELGGILWMLNQELDTRPRVGRTISRINNDLRFNKNRLPYRPFVYVSFPRVGRKWTEEALLYAGIHPHGVSVGFYPGGHRALRTRPIQESIRRNPRLFQRYLDECRISDSYWELAGGDGGPVTRWPLPRTSKRWINLESFTVGEYFSSNDAILARRTFIDYAQAIMLDLYPLWLFAASDRLREDLRLYRENAQLLAEPLTRAV